MVSPRNGLLALCLLVMGLYTLYQQLDLQIVIWPIGLCAGAVIGWLFGSGAWRAMGSDLVAALVTVCCVLFGSVLPLISLIKIQSLVVAAGVLGLVVVAISARRFVKS